MNKIVKDFCIYCLKTTDHIRYIEDASFNYNGTLIDYTETGRVCSVCGAENQSNEEWEESMAQIKANYRDRK